MFQSRIRCGELRVILPLFNEHNRYARVKQLLNNLRGEIQEKYKYFDLVENLYCQNIKFVICQLAN